MASKFLGGSPVSDTSNPFNASGVGMQAGADADVLASLDPEGHEASAMADLDAYGSSPVTDDGAAQRPLNPPHGIIGQGL